MELEAEAIACQRVFKASVPPEPIDVKGVRRVQHRFRLRLHPATRGPDGLSKDLSLDPLRLPMQLHRPHPLTSQVRREEGLGGAVTVDQDRVIADRARQDVGDRAEDRERVLPEQKGCAVKSQLGLGRRLRATYGLGLLSTPLWCRR
jgi:hypothetical protein